MYPFKRRPVRGRQPRSSALRLAVATTAVGLVLGACGGSDEPADVEELFGSEVTEQPVLTGDESASGETIREAASDQARATPPADSTPNATAPATPEPVQVNGHLEEGSSGRSVEQLQRALEALGFNPGTVDGAYGPMTRTAVGAFQRSVGHTPDGVVHEETAAAINQALRELQ